MCMQTSIHYFLPVLSIWGFDYKFTNYTLKKKHEKKTIKMKLDVQKKTLDFTPLARCCVKDIGFFPKLELVKVLPNPQIEVVLD